MKHTLLSIALSLQAGIAAMAATNDVASPDGRLVVTVGDEGGRIFYSVKYDGKPMIEKSSLGLKANIGDFSTGLRERAVSTKQTAPPIRCAAQRLLRCVTWPTRWALSTKMPAMT